MSAPKGANEHDLEHEPTPGMTRITLVYNGLFFAAFLFYFYMVYSRWPVQ